MKRLDEKHRSLIKNGVLAVLFSASILATSWLTFGLGSAAAQTVGFAFLAVVALSAFFANLPASIAVSILAALCFDYFFLPPVGTLTIASFEDWVSLAVFLFIAILISRLTSAAAQTSRNNAKLTVAMANLATLGHRLVSITEREFTLRRIAEETAAVFRFRYCSIHVYAAGTWDHAFGSSPSMLTEQVEERVQNLDRPLDWMILVAENDLGVRYTTIKKKDEAFAVLAVQDEEVTPETLNTVAYLIGTTIKSL